MFYEFQTTTYGKWILAGEHAVLRGHPALVFPIKSRKLTIHYRPTTKLLTAEYHGDQGQDAQLLFWSVIEQGLHLINRSINEVTGHFNVESTIPIGVGMGASAALCTAISRWFDAQSLLDNYTVEQFATSLEHLFHGVSSGLDIAGVAAVQGIIFQQKEVTPLAPQWTPFWYLSSSGQIGITSHCINQVKQLWDTDINFAQSIDLDMRNAVFKARHALEQPSSEALNLLAEAINEGASCFSAWGLSSETLLCHMQNLQQLGAIACKPTGSGGGGYVLSLWQTMPSPHVMQQLNLITL